MNVRCYLAVLFALCCSPAALFAQDYLYATGSPVYATTIPIDHGIINVNNGDIHLEFPIATKQQRGALALDEKLIYDSRIWKLVQNGSSISWAPTNAIGSGGWSFSSGAGSGTITYVLSGGTNPNLPNCDPEQPNYPAQYIAYQNWKWTDPAGTVHGFPTVATIQYEEENSICTPSSGVSSSSGFASDGSGYTLSVSNFSTPVITDVHGTSYYPASSANQGATDRNGNYWSKDSNGNLVDTSGVAPVLATTSGNTTTYSVLGVNGQRNNYVVTMESVSFDTAFGEEAASEDSGSFQAVQSIVLPDGSRYSFTYDSGTSPGHYGELTSMTLPTGGVVTYGFSNYLDSYKNQNRWLTSLTKDGGTTTV